MRLLAFLFQAQECNFMTLHTVPWACICMQLHKLACSSMNVTGYLSCHAGPWVYMNYHNLACGSMSLYAVPLFVWAAHNNFTVLVLGEGTLQFWFIAIGTGTQIWTEASQLNDSNIMFLEMELTVWQFKPVSCVYCNAASHKSSSAHWPRILLLRLVYLSSLSWILSYSFSQQPCQLRGPHAHNIGELLVWVFAGKKDIPLEKD